MRRSRPKKPGRGSTGGSTRLRQELAETRTRLAEAEETLRAIRAGEVDALVVEGLEGEKVFTLQGAETPYRFLVEEMNEGALLLSLDGTVLYANNRFSDLAGVPLERALGCHWQQFFLPGERENLAELLAAAKMAPQKQELHLHLEGAAVRPVNVSLCAMKREQLEGFSVVVTDLTERKAAELALRQANESLEARVLARTAQLMEELAQRKRAEAAEQKAREDLARANEDLERKVQERTAKLQELVGELEHFSYSITHDMRAPLRGMRGFAEMVAEVCAGCRQEEPKLYLRKIMASADRMDALITDALNYNKAVRQQLPVGPVDAAQLLRGMLDSYPEFQPARASIRLEGEIPRVMGNEAGLTQCFSNLLGNAVKFVEPGKRPEVRIWAERRGEWVRLWFEDNGIGIAQRLLPRIFDMFSRGHNTYEGTGIGLALVRKVTQRMGGCAGVESEVGKGSRFWVEFQSGDMPAAAGQQGT